MIQDPPGKLENLRASVRPVITYFLIGSVIVGFFLGKLYEKIDAGRYFDLVMMVATFWFVSRVAETVVKAMGGRCPMGCAICNGTAAASPPGASESVQANLVDRRKQ